MDANMRFFSSTSPTLPGKINYLTLKVEPTADQQQGLTGCDETPSTTAVLLPFVAPIAVEFDLDTWNTENYMLGWKINVYYSFVFLW